MAKHQLKVVNSDSDILINGFEAILIPEGEYTVAYIHHDTKIVFRTPKVFVHFTIMDEGAFYGKTIYRAYRANELIGKQGRNGRFKLAKRSELYLDICRLYESVDKRPDRVSLRPWRNLILNVHVRTVKKDYKQRELPECLQYSVIDKIEGIVAGCL